MKANMITLAVILFAVVMLVLHIHDVAWDTAKIVGASIAAVFLPLFVLARLQLGSSFSYGAKANRLVTTGLYSRIRNPIYVFGGLVIAGLSLFLSTWGPTVVAIVLLPLQKIRARNEERVLSLEFGEEYERYRKQTWF